MAIGIAIAISIFDEDRDRYRYRDRDRDLNFGDRGHALVINGCNIITPLLATGL